MIHEIFEIATLVSHSLLKIWPYLLITIPLAVGVQMSGAANHIRRVFVARPVPAIILATVVGAFSPFCSCGVIPVVASLLISGVPLGPVMSFWIASPSMDPEIFFLSVATLGWDLAVWRLVATLLLSLSAGFITHAAVKRGWISGPVLRHRLGSTVSPVALAKDRIRRVLDASARVLLPSSQPALCCASPLPARPTIVSVAPTLNPEIASEACSGSCASPKPRASSDESPGAEVAPFLPRLLRESREASLMVAKFMLIAAVLEAVLTRYAPQQWITSLLGSDDTSAILTAALVGVPLYTSNLTALPVVGALLTQGMNSSAALAFLIAGPTTTIPAMAAVWGLVRSRVFALYVGYALGGAVAMAALHRIVSVLY